ncbi:MAG: hypothetical protein KDK34_06300, partial [Leptospiraceae bacterium]|nr:hypothetical protein [Leptospiraceae bacterium]
RVIRRVLLCPMGKLRKLYEIVYFLIAIPAFLLVIFDATYLVQLPYTHFTMRDIYFRYFPIEWHYKYPAEELAANPDVPNVKGYDPRRLFYDPIKGIESHRFTDRYLEAYAQLEDVYNQGRDSAGETALINPGNNRYYTPAEAAQLRAQLDNMVELSIEMVNTDPFAIAGKSGELELIKNRMRDRMEQESSKDAFRLFFEQALLSSEGDTHLEFFNEKIRPYIQANFFRWIGEDGEKKDYFYLIDRWFVLFFWFDFFLRWGISIYTGQYRRWYLFAIRHGFEIFNLFPPHHGAWFRLLRVFPLVQRLNENGWLPDFDFAPQLVRDNAGIIASEISGLVLVNILKQTRSMIEERGIKNLAGMGQTDDTIDEMMDEVQDLLDSQAQLIATKVVPEIQPQIAE